VERVHRSQARFDFGPRWWLRVDLLAELDVGERKAGSGTSAAFSSLAPAIKKVEVPVRSEGETSSAMRRRTQ
jgi:hypothetical protein